MADRDRARRREPTLSSNGMVIGNFDCQIAPENIETRSGRSTEQTSGRNWNLAGLGAGICKQDWRTS
ncbi:hypothetical protein OHD62_28730 [Mesorhizobium sp. YC-39]|uniref:hypothetical protein n=1 Tax=unclassified Mesorhizobium TaxID=325217 RepID=UPI0021E73B8A|nr:MULTISPECIES: hypothetical protein [unclassified Mesorhizobium]MCV3208272.1 hypothetical protein [Mesorhizobium sp. YC-2]MCV3232378.1 hypothetical protein [Mesorhizobium sp. YC-39]